MRIDELTLKNYGPFQDAKLAFDRSRALALILAHNGLGKTSIARALELTLTGGVLAFSGKALSLANFVGTDPASPAEVAATIARDKPVTLRRRISAKGTATTVNGRETTKAVYDYFSPPTMKGPEQLWRVVCNVSGFFELADADQKALLMGLVDPAIPADRLPAADVLKGRVTAPRDLTDLARAYDEAFKGRAVAKKHLAALVIPAAPELAMQDVRQIDDRLDTLRAQERALVASMGAATGQKATLQEQLDGLVSKVSVLRGELQRLGEAAAADKTLADARIALESAKTANAEADQAGKVRTEKEGTLTKVRGWIDGIGKLGPVCVISSEVPCPLATTKREGFVEGWKKTAAVLEREIAALPASTLTPLAPIETRIRQAEQRVADLKGKQTEINAVEQDRTALAKRIDALPADPDNPDLAQLRERIRTGESNRRTAGQINDAHRERERLTGELTKRQGDVEAYEALCTAFGPKGLVETLLGERIGNVLGALNARLGAFRLSLAIGTDPWHIKINGRHPLMLAASQRFRAGIALQFALADLTGARWALIDGLDVLDTANRGAFFALAEQAVAKGWVEQIIATATVTNDAAFERAWPAPIQAFRIAGTEFAADSRVEVLGSAA